MWPPSVWRDLSAVALSEPARSQRFCGKSKEDMRVSCLIAPHRHGRLPLTSRLRRESLRKVVGGRAGFKGSRSSGWTGGSACDSMI